MRPGFELSYFKVAVKYFSHYAMGKPNNHCGLFNAKDILIEKQLWYYLVQFGFFT